MSTSRKRNASAESGTHPRCPGQSVTRSAGALYQAFPAGEARRMLRRREFHYTPKHASWLNRAEIEIGVLRSECLDRQIATKARLIAEVAACEQHRNPSGAPIQWSFATYKARAKMGPAYPHPNKSSLPCSGTRLAALFELGRNRGGRCMSADRAHRAETRAARWLGGMVFAPADWLKSERLTPFHENLPLAPGDNFYYARGGALLELAWKHKFHWSVARPHTIIWYGPGAAMNMGKSLAICATLAGNGNPLCVLQVAAVVQWTRRHDRRSASRRPLGTGASEPRAADKAFKCGQP